MTTAIHAENLGKKYFIGKSGYVRSMREVLNDALLRPLRLNRSHPDMRSASMWALREVSFDIKHGESVGLIGRNGSGKSTLLKILSRITYPTEGSFEVRGRLGSLLEVGIGFHPELTGRENVQLSCSLMGMKRTEVARKFDQIVDFSGIERFIDTPIKYYSSGMYIRLAFSVSTHLEPDILLLDEVLAVGDMEFQQKCIRKLAAMRKRGQTLILVSHVPVYTLDTCSRVIWLDQGRIVEDGDPQSVVGRYVQEQMSGSLDSIGTNQIEKPTEESSNNVVEVVEINAKQPTIKEAEPLKDGEMVIDSPEAVDGFCMLRVYLANENLEPLTEVDFPLSFLIVYEYQVETPLNNLRIGVRIWNDRQQPVLHSNVADNNQVNQEGYGATGVHRVTVKLPGSWFVPGIYYVEIGIGSASIVHFYRMNAFKFRVAKFSLVDLGPEAFHPLLEWTLSDLTL